MGLKAELNLSREGFDKMLAMFGTMLSEKHTLPMNLYEAEKLLRMLKMPYDKIHVCPKGCVLFRKEHKDANYCPKCKSSRCLEVDSGDGQQKQLSIPARVLQHLPFLPRIQRLFMTEESAKQMANGTILGRSYIRLMLKHGRTSMTNNVIKQLRPVIYVSRWQQMGSILME
jgi:hypothetical protein